jgi:hypothetical protein
MRGDADKSDRLSTAWPSGRSDWRSSPPAEKVRVFIDAKRRSQGRREKNAATAERLRPAEK